MNKSSSAVALALVSAVALSLGCRQECPQKLPDGRPNPNCQGAAGNGGGGHGGAHLVRTPCGGRSTGSIAHGSPRGGFGGTAAGHAGS